MFPTLWFGLQTYAVTLAVAFLGGTYLAVVAGRRAGIARWAIIDAAFWCLIFGMFGARAAFVVVEHQAFWDACVSPGAVGLSQPDCARVFRFWEGGMVFYGSVIGGGLALVWYARRYHIKLLLLLDIAAPTLAFGHAVGRIGCLAAGCCWGAECAGDWGVRFPHNTPAYKDFLAHGLIPASAHATPPLHPTQLYEGAAEVFILLFLVCWNARKRAHGELLGWWLLLYGLLRIATEVWRGDASRGFLWRWSWEMNPLVGLAPEHVTFLSTSQAIGAGAGLMGLFLLLNARRRARAL